MSMHAWYGPPSSRDWRARRGWSCVMSAASSSTHSRARPASAPIPASTTWRTFIALPEQRLKPATPLAAVLLDLDGTLLDTAPDMVRIVNMMRAQEKLAPVPYAHIRQYVSHGSAAVLRVAFPGSDGVRLAALQSRFLGLYREHLVVETLLFPGFEEVLAALEAHGIPWGVITNKPGWLTEPLLREFALYERAGCVLSGDSLPVCKPRSRPLPPAPPPAPPPPPASSCPGRPPGQQGRPRARQGGGGGPPV